MRPATWRPRSARSGSSSRNDPGAEPVGLNGSAASAALLVTGRGVTTAPRSRRAAGVGAAPLAHPLRCRGTSPIGGNRGTAGSCSGFVRADSSSRRSSARRALAFAAACRPELGGNAATRCSSGISSLWLGMGGSFQILFLTATCTAVVGDGDSCSPTLPCDRHCFDTNRVTQSGGSLDSAETSRVNPGCRIRKRRSAGTPFR